MRKKILLFSALGTLVLGMSVCTALGVSSFNKKADAFSSTRATAVPTEGDAYDSWCNSWSKPGHIYFHYNRGAEKSDYNEFCLWIWNNDNDTAGTLWAYSGVEVVSSTLKLVPMSTHWMTKSELGLEGGSATHIDNYGVICDVDLTKTLYEGKKKIKEGQPEPANKECSLEGCEDLGFLFPKINSMNGSSHWTSDGGRDNDIPDWNKKENKRSITGGTTEHIFLASGTLDEYAYFAGSGIPEVKINPMDTDTTGQYSSKTETVHDETYGVAKTSNSFKDLGVGYQIFVASFRDSNGDGIGDIRGIIDSLDYLQDLGVECLWLTPIQQCESYHGYDISDYYAVDPKFGTTEDYRELIFTAHQKGIKVLMDLVLNHTSKNNVWFKKSQWAVNSGVPGTETDDTGINWRNVYTWKFESDMVWRADRTADGHNIKKTDGLPTYQKVTVKEFAEDPYGPSWYKDGESHYYYYGKFGSGMPEINYESNDTRKLVIDMAKYWMSFGLDGYRLDAVKHIYMRDEVDNIGSDIVMTDVGQKTAYDEEKGQYITQPYDYSSDLSKNIRFWKQFSNELKSVYPDCFLVGENFDGYGTRMAGYYQGLDSQFDFSNYYHVNEWIYGKEGGATMYKGEKGQASETYDPFSSNSDSLEITVDEKKYYVPGGHRSDFINGAFTSNHDVMRAINQANGSDEISQSGSAEEIGKAKVHAAITILNRGLSWIYYGDELGMSSNTNTHVPTYGNENNMDIWYRQPFMWNDTSLRPNLKVGIYDFIYDQHNQKLSDDGKGITYNNGTYSSTNEMYNFYKQLIALKKLYPKDARLSFHEYTSINVLVMDVWEGSNLKLKIFINVGKNSDTYNINLEGDGWTKVAQINHSGDIQNHHDITDKYSVIAFSR